MDSYKRTRTHPLLQANGGEIGSFDLLISNSRKSPWNWKKDTARVVLCFCFFTMWRPQSSISLLSVILLLLTTTATTTVQARRIPCTSTAECEALLQAGAACVAGTCQNPFHRRGCFGAPTAQDDNKASSWRPRVCHSQDGVAARAAGYCVAPDAGLAYTEIRILTQNWYVRETKE